MSIDEFLSELREIFETKKINKKKKITDMKNWDSLTSLSVLSLIDTNFKKKKINATKIEKFKSIEELYNYASN